MGKSLWQRLFGGGVEEVEWCSWTDDPVSEKTGVSFDRTPAGEIRAPKSKFRVCAYHIDFDERPTCYVDVDSLEQAEHICQNLADLRGDFNVDYAFGYDDTGKRVTDPPW